MHSCLSDRDTNPNPGREKVKHDRGVNNKSVPFGPCPLVSNVHVSQFQPIRGVEAAQDA